MPIELTPEQQAVLKETAPAADPAEFQALLAAARPEMDRVVREVMEPHQSVESTIVEARDLYLTVNREQKRLAAVAYDDTRRALFRDAIRLAVTSADWFTEGARTGNFRARTVEEVVAASRPWRARLKAYGEQAFVFEPDLAEQFADVNSTGTVEEEKDDLRKLNDAVAQHQARLAAVGMPAAFVLQGQALFQEVEGHGLLGILGVRSQEEAIGLRNRIFTYATLLGREARAAGINACFEDVEAKRKFEAASFRDALRRVKPRRKKAEAAPAAPGAPGAPAAPASPAAPATSAAPAAPAGTKPS
jgi:hypothetical protein